jgi:hypothetical protein
MNPVNLPAPTPPPGEHGPPPSPGLRELPDGRVVLPRFFVLDEHVLEELMHGEDGKPLRDANGELRKRTTTIDRDVLEQIAANNNARIADTGDVCPVVVGHTKDDAAEHKQPDIIGYAADFRVEPFFNTGRYAISVTPVAKDRASVELFRRYPRRSVEFWRGSLQIDPISLLGATTPERDLGLHRFSSAASRGEQPVRYSITDANPTLDLAVGRSPTPTATQYPEATPVADPTKTTSTSDIDGDGSHDGLVEKVLAALQGTKEFAFIRTMMEQQASAQPQPGQEQQPPADPSQGQDDGDMSDDDLEALLAGHGGQDGGQGYGDDDGGYDDDGSQQYMSRRGSGPRGHYTDNDQYGGMGDDHFDYAAGVGGMDAGYLPGYGGRKVQYQRRAEVAERLKYAKLEERLAGLETRLASAEAENQQLKAERDRAEVESDLQGLFVEGLDFDHDAEFDRLVRFSRDEREKELGRMRSCYKRRSPNGGKPPVQPGAVAQAPARYQRAQDKSSAAPAPVDHQETRRLAQQAIDAGFNSVGEYLASKQSPAAADVAGR